MKLIIAKYENLLHGLAEQSQNFKSSQRRQFERKIPITY